MTRKAWSELDTKFALYLYFQLTFGQIDSRNPQIVRLAERMGRTPSSLAMKLANIASLNPKITGTGRSGLTGATKLDRRIWDAFHADWTALVSEVEEFLSDSKSNPPYESIQDISETDVPTQYAETSTSLSLVETRLGQQFFRRAVLANYELKCCVTGIAEPALLNASHIIPWRTGISHRHNPANGFCLSATFDRAFDVGLMTINRDLCIQISKSLLNHKDDTTRKYFKTFDGKSINRPLRFFLMTNLLIITTNTYS